MCKHFIKWCGEIWDSLNRDGWTSAQSFRDCGDGLKYTELENEIELKLAFLNDGYGGVFRLWASFPHFAFFYFRLKPTDVVLFASQDLSDVQARFEEAEKELSGWESWPKRDIKEFAKEFATTV